MPTNSVRLRIWCEDHAQERFARELFQTRFGVDRRRLTFMVAPHGKGAASRWVIRQNEDEVRRQVRATRSQQGLGFLLMVDGDNVGWRNRLETLVGNSGSREQGDRLAVWAPTWSVETWVLYLCDEQLDGRVIDESRSFKQTIAQRGGFTQDLLRRAARAWDPPRATERNDVPSLAQAREELMRLPLR